MIPLTMKTAFDLTSLKWTKLFLPALVINTVQEVQQFLDLSKLQHLFSHQFDSIHYLHLSFPMVMEVLLSEEKVHKPTLLLFIILNS